MTLEDLLAEIELCEDAVELATALLRFCRAHEALLLATLGTAVGMHELQTIVDSVDDWLPIGLPAITTAHRTRCSALLDGEPHPEVRARALAVALDLHAREWFGWITAQRRWTTLTCDLAYSIAEPALPKVFPTQTSFTTRRANRPNRFAVYELPGLRLGPTSELPFEVAFDHRAGSFLEDALSGRVMDVAAAQPNSSLDELDMPDMSGGQFFGMKVKDARAQVAKLDVLVRKASDARATMLVFPEMCLDESISDAMITRLLAGPSPPVVLAGSAHRLHDGRPVNRAAVVYPTAKYVVEQDKFSPVSMTIADHVCQEGIDCGNRLTIHAGPRWVMVSLTCADLLDPSIADLIVSLSPNIVLVASMTPKTDAFAAAVTNLVDRCQSIVVLANNPGVWDGHAVAPALFGRPIAGATLAVAPSAPAPGVALLQAEATTPLWLP